MTNATSIEVGYKARHVPNAHISVVQTIHTYKCDVFSCRPLVSLVAEPIGTALSTILEVPQFKIFGQYLFRSGQKSHGKSGSGQAGLNRAESLSGPVNLQLQYVQVWLGRVKPN